MEWEIPNVCGYVIERLPSETINTLIVSRISNAIGYGPVALLDLQSISLKV